MQYGNLMKRISAFLLISFSLLLTACNLSLAEDVTPPPGYVAPTAQPTLGPLYPAAAPDPQNGAAIYVEKCAACHGDTGLGDGAQGKQLPVTVAALGLPQTAQKASPVDWYTAVSQGRMERFMPPFASLTEQERWDVVAYAFSLHTTPDQLADGQALFESNCANCDTAFFTDQQSMSALSEDDLLGLMVQGNASFPAFGANLGEDDLYSVAAYLRSLSFAAAPVSTPTAVSASATPAATESGTATLEAYPNPVSETPAAATEAPIAVEGVGTVRGSVVFPGGSMPGDITVTLRGYDHAMDASGPQETLTVAGTPEKDGSLAFENIDLIDGRILLIEADYNGILYQSEMTVVEAGSSEVVLPPLTLYETSSDLSVLTVDQGHIFLDVSAGQIQIIEFFNVVNPTQLSILVPVTSDQMALAKMPEGTTSLGFDAQQGAAMPVQSTDGFAMKPSEESYGVVAGFQMAYDKSAEIALPFVLTMPAGSSVFVPVGVTLEGEGLTDKGQQDIGNGTTYQVYEFGPLEADSTLTVKLDGQPELAPDSGTDTATPSINQPLVIGAVVLGLLLIGAGAWLYIRDRKREEEIEDEEDEDGNEFEDADSVLDAIIALDDLHRAGKLPTEAYQQRRAELKEQLKRLESSD
jgi:mono/diheme cytochrome c family protein